VITRHGRDGAVLFVSPAAEALFGSRIAELHGHGLFDRVHVADRPAYLTALGDAAALGKAVRSSSACGATAPMPTVAAP
jgi:cell cycle sensor histidine kinase DivJ